MAQSGYTPISLYFSATGAAVPTAGNLVAGELALNTNDGKLYFKNSSGVVTLLAGSTSGPAGGSTTQVQYNNSGVLAGITGATTNGTVLTLVTPVLGAATATSLQGIIGNVTPAAGNFTTLGASSTATLNTLVSSGATLTGGTINGMTVGATTASTGAFTTLTTSSTFTLGGTIAGGGNQINNVIIGTTTPLAGNFTSLNATYANLTSFLEVRSDSGAIYQNNAANTRYWASLVSGGSSIPNLDISYYNGSIVSTVAQYTANGLAVTGTLSATGTLSGGTSGTAYSFSGSAPATSLTLDSSGNLGIGTSSPAQTLHVKTSTSATPITLGVLSNATSLPALSFNGSYASTTMAGIYGNGATASSLYYEVPSGNNHFFGIADSTKMTLDSAGNLGLGVTPSAWSAVYRAFQIGAQGAFWANATANDVILSANFLFDVGNTSKYIANGYASYYLQNNGEHIWKTAPNNTSGAGATATFTQAMTLTAAGNLGIGTTSPYYPLQVNTFASAGSLSSGGNWNVSYSDGSAAIGYSSTNSDSVFGAVAGSKNIIFAGWNGSTNVERARIDASGNLLVGTTTRGIAGNSNVVLSLANGNVTAYQSIRASGGEELYLVAAAGLTGLTAYSNSPLTFGTNNTERARIDSSGSLQLKKASNETEATAQFSIAGSGYEAYHWLDATAYYIGQNSSVRSLRIYSNSYTAGVNLASGGTSWGTFSDERLKYDVEPITNGLDKLNSIRCVSYRLKDVDASDSQKKLGVIAQDLVGVVDEVIDITKRHGDETDYMSVRYTELIPVLVKAIQEQQALITQLTARITALETA